MVAPTFGADRVLVTTESTGNGALVLGPAVPGFHDPDLAGLVSGRRYTFASLNAVGTGGSPTNWDRGVGVLTRDGAGVWTLTRPLVRRNRSGGTSAVNWGSGTKYVVLGLSSDDVAMLDTNGWLGLGGDAGRERAAPLDVVADPGGPLARFRALFGSVLADVLTVTKDGTVANLPLSVPAPSAAAHAARQMDVDAARVVSTITTSADGGVNIALPATGSVFELTASITGLAGTGAGRSLVGFVSVDGTTFLGAGSYSQQLELAYAGAYSTTQDVTSGVISFSPLHDVPAAMSRLVCTIYLDGSGFSGFVFTLGHIRDGSTRAIRRGWAEVSGGRARILRIVDGLGQGVRAGSTFSLRKLA
ncbi:hypothetical protein VQH23_16315 [Pararoseomonas sp. SCSIO 73927]|uniref:hypothetical protein n=1 Tax=Pararoseomonas sp. SCSIO 73927 TaxID=3114537 RepID=UPI0030D5EBB7